MGRVVELPRTGRLFVATDFQGNARDFSQMATIFRHAARRSQDVHLVLTGDLVHGPEIPESQWPDYLGTYYQADSLAVVEEAEALTEEFPGRVHCLLGNHEHAHVGGPVVSKFFPDEAGRLESLMGKARAKRLKKWLASWPLVAFAPEAQLLMVHGAPHAVLEHRSDLDRVELDAGEGVVDEILADILWPRSTSSKRARSFLAAIDSDLRVALYGHDVAREGHAIDREPLLCVSTSFGCFDGDKVYLDWPLDEPAVTAQNLAARGLRPLWPEARPVYRKPVSGGVTSPPPRASSSSRRRAV
ncbi:MAG: metallophosphoesterase [Polyangiaceae bacterium]